MRIIVQKFGGTSVREAAQRRLVTNWVVQAVENGFQPVVVVSAMGRRGDPYATDTLLGLLANFPMPPETETDLLVSCGEVISAVVMAGHLRQEGLNPEVMTGGQAGIHTDTRHGDAQIVKLEPTRLKASLEEGHIPVVAGFQGVGSDGLVTTLGRGGSDTTAVALGAALGAEVVEIFTDVDGIKTADPRIVPEARTISEMDYHEVFQLANLGARVIHPRAVELARQFSVPVRVRSTFSNTQGTLVGPGRRVLDSWAHRDPDHAVTGVTQLRDLIQFRVTGPADAGTAWTFRLFDLLGRRGVSVDLINLFPDHVFFCVVGSVREHVERALGELDFPYQVFDDRAKVSIVGSAIEGLPGVVGRVMEALARENIRVLQSADSHATITLLLEKKDMEAAVRALHQQFGLDREVERL
ncbi:aspartate kinase [Sulfobacillus harzensis]|uniref:Aspartokinase n=1 Tax=Sulfobacillus harzensis TaxID=2729629 RepID=A0A7Y0L4R9_9FIRM|nr:aspartate kinase [Sulfobacillus harzensis]NMP21849.1 aspartate kinase [Sulfobacillus harzensis]